MQPARQIPLRFQPHLDGADARKELRDGLSAILQLGPTLWLANDESASLERLVLGKYGGAGDHRQFQLRDYLDLPDPGDEDGAPEVDIEGIDCAGDYLWVTGSHSLKRSKVEDAEDDRAAQKCLARTEKDANRYLLARIPIVQEDGLPALARTWRKDSEQRHAQRVPGSTRGNALTRLLRKDKHLGAFVGLPGKENGFDIEGLAVAGERLFLGLRGPVLRGWATVLELRPRGGPGDLLELARFAGTKGRKRVRKHFLDLGGLGVRDLRVHGDDLLLLAGPTMSLDGPVRVLRWPGGAASEAGCMVGADELQLVFDLPFGAGCDHAEGISLFQPPGSRELSLLVVHDQPAPGRQRGESTLLADVYTLA